MYVHSALKVFVCVCLRVLDGHGCVAHDHELSVTCSDGCPCFDPCVACEAVRLTKSTTWRDKRRRGTQWTWTRLS